MPAQFYGPVAAILNAYNTTVTLIDFTGNGLLYNINSENIRYNMPKDNPAFDTASNKF